MPVNPRILDKINNDNIPDEIKEVLNEVLKTENSMEIQNARKDYANIGKVLEKYADNDQIKKFCDNYD